MLKKNLSKSALVVALLTTTVIWRGTTAYAEDPNQAFTLDPMIVTAHKEQKPETWTHRQLLISLPNKILKKPAIRTFLMQ